jgi:hypothetical protein
LYEKVEEGGMGAYAHLAAPDTHDSLKPLGSTDIPSEIIEQFGWIRKSRKWKIVVNLHN